MFVYISAFFFLFMISLFQLLSVKIQKDFRCSFVFSLVSFFFVSAFVLLRYKTGTDWETYYEYFYNTTFYWEKGWSFVNYYLFQAGFDAEFLFLIVGLSSLLLKVKSLVRVDSNVAIFLFLIFPFLIGKDLGTIRQGLAISICFFSYLFLLENRKVVFAFFVFVAVLFHQSSVFFIFSLFFVNFFLNVRLTIVFLIFAFSLYYFSIVDFFLEGIVYSLGFDDGIFYKLKRYLTYTDEFVDNSFPYLSVIKKLLLLALLIFLGALRREYQEDRAFKTSFNLYFFGIFIFILLGEYSQLRRLVGYFELFEYLCVLLMISKLKYWYNSLFLLVFCSSFNFLKLIVYVKTYEEYLVPYKTIINYLR